MRQAWRNLINLRMLLFACAFFIRKPKNSPPSRFAKAVPDLQVPVKWYSFCEPPDAKHRAKNWGMTLEQREILLSDRIVRSPGALSTLVDNTAIVLTLDTGTFCTFDPIGTEIWDQLEQTRLVHELCNRLAEAYDASPETIERDVLDLLGAMLRQGLIEVHS